jgi:hypothetical protein
MRQQKGTSRANAKGSDQRNRKLSKKMIEVEEARMKIEGESSPFHPLPPTKLNNIFMCVEDLNEEIHTNQTGAFPHTSQHGNCYIMVAIHLNANYIIAEPMQNRMEG